VPQGLKLGLRRSWWRWRSSGARRSQESFKARFQGVERLLFAGDLLFEVIQLGFARGVTGVIGFRVDVILFQGELALKKLKFLLRFGELLLLAGHLGGVLGFWVGIPGR